ncbi:MAG: type IV secretory system conjugative DNA transfer family protein, partial [Promicromonosporaceae bacterium]|nr:type IV secretory system conjugative DNA transfer family protein [Promicromonosporaceae bacterium]
MTALLFNTLPLLIFAFWMIIFPRFPLNLSKMAELIPQAAKVAALAIPAVLLVVTVVTARRDKRQGRRLLRHLSNGQRVVMWLVSLPFALTYTTTYLIARRGRHTRKPKPKERVITLAELRDDFVEKHGHLPGPVLGFRGGEMVTGHPNQSTLVIGSTRTGKSTACIIPSIWMAAGFALVTTTKTDLMIATWEQRAKLGRVWLFDPKGEELLTGSVRRIRWSPLVSIKKTRYDDPGTCEWDKALTVAYTMRDADKFGGTNGGDGGFFVGMAGDLLASLLYAAHLAGEDMGIAAIWSDSIESEETRDQISEILGEAARSGQNSGAARALIKFSDHYNTSEKTRAGINSSVKSILRLYNFESACDVAKSPNFDPEEAIRRRDDSGNLTPDTVYTTSPASKQALYGPVIAAFIETMKEAVYRQHARAELGLEPRLPNNLFVFDEMSTTAPIDMAGLVSQSGGQNLTVMGTIISLKHAEMAYGP